MTSGVHILTQIELAGVTVLLEGEAIRLRFAEDQESRLAPLVNELREHKAEVVRALQARARTPRNPDDEWTDHFNDPYFKLAMIEHERIRHLDWRPGLGKWLEKANRGLHHEIYNRLPSEIDRLWEAHAPMMEFQAVLDRWVEAHEKALSLWRAADGHLERS